MKSRERQQNNTSLSEAGFQKAFRQSMRRALLLFLIIPLLGSTMLIVNDHGQHRRLAEYFTNILRYEVIKGSMRDAVYQTQRITTEDGPFFSISFDNDKGIRIINQKLSGSDVWLFTDIRVPIYYTSEPNAKIAGVFIYSYDLTNLVIGIISFFSISGIGAFAFLVRQRRVLGIRFKQLLDAQRNETVARTINGLAHDLRAPLNMIEVYLIEKAHEDHVRYRTAKLGLQRINAMVDSLRHNEGNLLVRPASTRLDMAYLEQLAQSIAEQHGKELEFSVPVDLVANIDSAKFERVLQNLLVNAIEAAKSKVKLIVVETSERLSFQIYDNGSGVSPEFLGRLFTRGSTQGKNGGTGLGLFYVKAIVEGHGGQVGYRRENDWTVFQVDIPHGISKGTSFDIVDVRREIEKIQEKTLTVGVLHSDSGHALGLVRQLGLLMPDIKFTCQKHEVETADILYVQNLELLEDVTEGKRSIIFEKLGETAEHLVTRLQFFAHHSSERSQ